jgi:DNA-binding transcriptional ArsR family regulator
MTYQQVLNALGDPTRRQVFDRLRAGPRSVAVIAQELPVSRPAVSQHLKILKEAGLVRDEAAGTRRVYHLDLDGLASLRTWLDGFRDQPLDAHQAEIRRQIDERKST